MFIPPENTPCWPIFWKKSLLWNCLYDFLGLFRPILPGTLYKSEKSSKNFGKTHFWPKISWRIDPPPQKTDLPHLWVWFWVIFDDCLYNSHFWHFFRLRGHFYQSVLKNEEILKNLLKTQEIPKIVHRIRFWGQKSDSPNFGGCSKWFSPKMCLRGVCVTSVISLGTKRQKKKKKNPPQMFFGWYFSEST